MRKTRVFLKFSTSLVENLLFTTARFAPFFTSFMVLYSRGDVILEEQEFFYTAELPKYLSELPTELMGGKAKAIVKIIDIADIYPDPEAPPKHYKTEELAALAMDILKNGLHNPIAILAVSRKNKEVFQIISGEKRFRACLLARIERVPCTVIYKYNENNEEIILPPRNYFEKAKIYAEAINRGLYTEESIAKSANLPQEEVHTTLLLLVFTQEEQNLLINSGVPEASAKKLAKMDAHTRRGFLETIIHGTNVAAVCAKISEAYAEDAAENQNHFQKTKFRIRGNGFFLNSINHAVETMREGGVNIDCNTEETSTDTILTLTIPKSGDSAL